VSNLARALLEELASNPEALEQLRELVGDRSSRGLPIDAKAAGELLGVPPSWVLRQARADAIPHTRLGHYVRFFPDELLAWARSRRRGPTYAQGRANGGPGDAATPRGPTPTR
jgi:hypothetical protein